MFVIAFTAALALFVLLAEALHDHEDGVSYTIRMCDDGYPRTVFVSPRCDGGLRSYACHRGLATFRVHAESDYQACKLLTKKLRSARQNMAG